MRDIGLLIIRLVAGGLLAGHGSQKLFGWFGGRGPQGTGRWLESMGLRPGQWWAALAGLGEFAGGLLTALGLFHPVGPILILGPMSVAAKTVHAGKPIWAAEGGAELPVTYMAVGIGLSLAGPGRYSADRLLGFKVSPILAALVGVGVVLAANLTIERWRAAQKHEVSAPAEEPSEVAEEEPHDGKGAAA